MIHRYIIEATDEVKGFEEAIERLDREWGIEELEPCEDSISRQAVLDEAFEVDTKEYGRIDVVGVDAINSLPTVTPQSRIGHWINIDEKSAICSCCNRNNTLYGDFCKWCGVKNN